MCAHQAPSNSASQLSCSILVASEKRENSPWNLEGKQGQLPGRAVSSEALMAPSDFDSYALRWNLGKTCLWEIFLKFYVRFTYSVNIHWTNIVWTPTVGQAFECWSFNDLKQTNKQIITTTKTVNFIFQWREEVNHSYIMYLWCADKCPRLLSSLIPSTFLPWIPDQSCLSVQSLSYRWQEETSIEADTAPP